MQQSSSSSSPDTDDRDQERPTSLLNYDYPAEHKPETATPLEAVKETESSTVEEEDRGKVADKVTPVENEPEENLTVESTCTDQEMKTQFEEKEEEGEIKEEEEEEDEKTLPEEKEKEVEDEKENEPPEEKAQQQPSPAEENTFEVEPSEEDKAVVEEPKLPSPPVSIVRQGQHPVVCRHLHVRFITHPGNVVLSQLGNPYLQNTINHCFVN